jgi:hypothetical protein
MKGCLKNEKLKRHKVIINEESKHKALENQVHELNQWLFELDNERQVAETGQKKTLSKTLLVKTMRVYLWRQFVVVPKWYRGPRGDNFRIFPSTMT